MSVESSIQKKLTAVLSPFHLDVLNESHMHNVPEGSESHFKVIVISEKFDKQNLVQRHRLVNEALSEELNTGVHALSITALTPDEWFEREGTPHDSPPCLGGSKQD